MTLLRPIHPTISSYTYVRYAFRVSQKENNNKKPTNLLLVVVDIDRSFLPFASRDFALKHDVDFTVGAVLHFRKFKVCDYEAEESRCAPDVTASATDYITKICVSLMFFGIFLGRQRWVKTYDWRPWG